LKLGSSAVPSNEHSVGGSYALIVAADKYCDPTFKKLRSPAQDVRELTEVLKDPAIGGYQVSDLMNKPYYLVREGIEEFFADRCPDDLLVLYFSCHGIKDPAGNLYFTASTTKANLLASSGISSAFVHNQVENCRARSKILLLDCCYSGAYLKGYRPRAGDQVDLDPMLGRGWAAITSSRAIEYSYEDGTSDIAGTARPSVFTSALVEGLRTGDADQDGDGLISVDDLYDYVLKRVRERTPVQTPEKKGDVRGDLIIARNPRAVAAKPQPTDTVSPATSEPSQQYPPALNYASALTAYLPIATLFKIFTRDRFVRMNVIQALVIYMMYSAAGVCSFYYDPRSPSKIPYVSSQPWRGLLIASSAVGYSLATALLLFCIIQLSRQKRPTIFVLTRAAAFIAGEARHA
jgi:uncharacterized caspase-like protein